MNDEAIHARRWWTLGVLCLSLVIVTVGNSSLNVAIPTLSEDLHATTSQLQWAVAGYSLVFAGLLFTAGAIGDRFGRKGALQLGLVGFFLAALLATASTEMWQIIALRGPSWVRRRVHHAVDAVDPRERLRPDERTKAIAIWAGVIGAAGALGPLASGWLLGHFWYGSVFLVNIPIVLIALVGAFLVPEVARSRARQARSASARCFRSSASRRSSTD